MEGQGSRTHMGRKCKGVNTRVEKFKPRMEGL